MDKVLEREEGNTDRKQEANRQEASLFFCLKQRFSVLEGGKVEERGQMKKRGVVPEGIKNKMWGRKGRKEKGELDLDWLFLQFKRMFKKNVLQSLHDKMFYSL